MEEELTNRHVWWEKEHIANIVYEIILYLAEFIVYFHIFLLWGWCCLLSTCCLRVSSLGCKHDSNLMQGPIMNKGGGGLKCQFSGRSSSSSSPLWQQGRASPKPSPLTPTSPPSPYPKTGLPPYERLEDRAFVPAHLPQLPLPPQPPHPTNVNSEHCSLYRVWKRLEGGESRWRWSLLTPPWL